VRFLFLLLAVNMCNDTKFNSSIQKSQRTNRSVCVSTGLAVLVLLTCSLSSGCRSGALSKMKMPTLPKLSAPNLAFWKKDGVEMPPPPARHFAPSATDTEVYRPNDTEYAKSNVDMDAVKQRIDDQLEVQKRSYAVPSGSVSELAQKTKDSFDGSFPNASTAATKVASDGSDFVASTKSGLKTGISDAQKKFNDALASTKKNVDADMTNKPLSKPKLPGKLDTWKNDFKLPGRMLTKNADSKSDGGGFGFPESSSEFKAPAETFQSNKSTELAKVNQSLYDSKGQLIESGNAAVKNAADSVSNQFAQAKSSFGSTLDKLKPGKAADTARDFVANNPVSNAASDFKQAMSSSVNQAMSNANQSTPALRPSSQPIDLAKSSGTPATAIAAAPLNNSSFASSNSGSSFASSPKPSDFRASNPVASANGGSFYKNGGGLANANPPTNLQPIENAPTNILRNRFATAQAGGTDFGTAQYSTASTLPDWQSPNVGAPVSHVADVDIPANVLSGNGNYAPGSVHELKR
jgi:hypothetical protein